MEKIPKLAALFFFLSITADIAVLAATDEKVQVVNEILFSVAGEPSTSRDMQLYKAVLNEIFQKNKISKFTKKFSDDFLLSRLSYKEAVVFELTGTKMKESDAARRKMADFSKAEIDREIDVVSKALELIEIKENQVKLQARFDTWFELLKRKYQLKLKSPEIK